MTLISVQHTLVKCTVYTFTISLMAAHTWQPLRSVRLTAEDSDLLGHDDALSDCSAHDEENTKMSVTTHLTQRHIPDILYPQQYYCENLKSCFNSCLVAVKNK